MKEMSNKMIIYCTVFTVLVSLLAGARESFFRIILISGIFWILWLLAHLYDEGLAKKKGDVSG